MFFLNVKIDLNALKDSKEGVAKSGIIHLFKISLSLEESYHYVDDYI